MSENDFDEYEKNYNRKLENDFVENLKGRLKRLSRQELKKRIEDFLQNNCICTLATCSDNMPRSTIVRYRVEGLTVYVFTEGGGKIKNLRQNRNISLTVCGEYSGIQSVESLQAWGTAEIISPKDGERYVEIRDYLNIGQRQDLQDAGIKQIPDMYILKIDITRARFLSFPEGILNQEWKSEVQSD